MDAVRIEAADRNDFFHLRNADLARRRGRLVEVAGGLAEHQVAALVGFPALDDAEVGANSTLQDIILAVEILDLLTLGHLRADAGLGIESRDARAARPHPLGQRALRTEFYLQLARQ